jgi:hypothetical protein
MDANRTIDRKSITGRGRLPGPGTKITKIATLGHCHSVDPNRKQAVIAIVAAIADAVSDARRIVERVEKSF